MKGLMKTNLKVVQLYHSGNQLIKKAAKNNREAQHVLFEKHAPKMLSVCRYYVKDLQKAEEVMMNGFFKAFTKLDTFKNEGSFEGWLRKIMVRESISFLRLQKQIEFSMEEVENLNEHAITLETDLEVVEIQQLIDELPDGYKMVFVMYAMEGYKHHEIAEMLNITEGTSKSQLYKARQMLQQRIKKLNTTSYGTH
jgi:RNA polymerase sigma-70 factor (ECF subfamily)